MQVFLIRHPRPLIEAGICYGRLDVDCLEPQLAAERLRPRLPADLPVFSSPLRRARRLAEALSADICIDQRLSEIDFGTWEGKRWDEIGRGEIDAWAEDVLNFTPPGGESVAALQSRALDFAASLNLPQLAVVTHAGIMRSLLGHWLSMPVTVWSQLEFEFGSLTLVETDTGPHS